MNDQNDKDEVPTVRDSDDKADERARNLGWGIGLLVAGCGMLANQMGWMKSPDWFVPAILIGVAVTYLYKALSR